MPHHRLIAYGVALELLRIIREADIRDTKLRHQALEAAKGACLNTGEAAGRGSRADKARVIAIARGEAVEAFAALEIAEIAGDVKPGFTARALPVADRLVALLTGFIRH